MKGVCVIMAAAKRSAGVLLHISSLNGPFGVGVMGEQAKRFADKIAGMGFKAWQVLPLNPVDEKNSPYCSASAFAGNYVYIDPLGLQRQGLVSAAEVEANVCHGSIYTADFAFALEKREQLLRLAFSRLDDRRRDEVETFCSTRKWARDFALFMACRKKHDGKVWWLWEDEYSSYEKALTHSDELEPEAEFQRFVQYEFSLQWNELKSYVNSLGVKIIGDMPIYVNRDSADTWSSPELFELDEETKAPTLVAGVPPDYFSVNGQKWGNPLYNWDMMEKDGYSWWLERIGRSLELYDRVRIDHFRAFASFWAVPAEAETAKTGEWRKGPGMKLFERVKAVLPDADIIAEDLGIFGEDVVELLRDSGFPGMRVIQFGFDPNGDSTHLPHNYPLNTVAYVGTHDNNTLLGWMWEATPEERAFALRYCGFSGDWSEGGYRSASCRAVIETVWRSSALTAVVSFQDMCGFGRDARMNVPGEADGNWLFRAGDDALGSVDTEYYKQLNRLFRR